MYSRYEVYKNIDTEREYQEMVNNNNEIYNEYHELVMGEAILAIQVNLGKVLASWYSDSPKNDYQITMEHIREIAALSVYLGEKYGMPPR